MHHLFTRLALIIALTITPTLLVAADTLPKPEAISEETIYLTEKISKNYDTIVIKEFSVEGAGYSSVNDEEKVKIVTMTPLLLSNIALTLEGELKAKKLFKNIKKNGEVTGKAVILEGQISEFNAGSRALKFFVGFGAGKAYLKFKGRLVDAATGKELATFEDRETGYRGAVSLESYEDLFPHQAKSIGQNLAKFLEKLY
jgi:curli biogenesis system outer membrane secretion channel CsgG